MPWFSQSNINLTSIQTIISLDYSNSQYLNNFKTINKYYQNE